MPHYGDHDFPIPNYLIEPDRYLHIQSKSQIPVPMKDKLGRNVMEVPATVPMWIYNRCAKNTSRHCASHFNHIRNMSMKEKYPNLEWIIDAFEMWPSKQYITSTMPE